MFELHSLQQLSASSILLLSLLSLWLFKDCQALKTLPAFLFTWILNSPETESENNEMVQQSLDS